MLFLYLCVKQNNVYFVNTLTPLCNIRATYVLLMFDANDDGFGQYNLINKSVTPLFTYKKVFVINL